MIIIALTALTRLYGIDTALTLPLTVKASVKAVSIVFVGVKAVKAV